MDSETFADELQQNPINVARANLHLARELAYPRLDVAHYIERLQQLAGRARAYLERESTVAEQARMLARFLFEEEGFQGNVADYGDPRNSYLNEVLERRLGIPITLSILYVALARQVGLEAYGVSLPGHFIVGVREWEEGDSTRLAKELLYDPFHQGRALTMQECRQLVQETAGYDGPFDPRWLFPAAPRDVLVRILNNLRLSYVQRAEWETVLSVIAHLRQVQPEVPEHLRDLGLVHYQQGRFYPAAHYLEAYLEQAPETPEATAIRENLSQEFARWAQLN